MLYMIINFVCVEGSIRTLALCFVVRLLTFFLYSYNLNNRIERVGVASISSILKKAGHIGLELDKSTHANVNKAVKFLLQ